MNPAPRISTAGANIGAPAVLPRTQIWQRMRSNMARTYHIISADSHLDLSRAVETSRTGEMEGPGAESGSSREWRGRDRDCGPGARSDRLHPGAWACRATSPAGADLREQRRHRSPGAPVGEQDADGVDAEILFSRIQGTLRRVKDDQCYEALVHAYNEYLIEEYAAPDRLIPMGVIPTSGIEAAMRELEYCGRMGFKGVLIDKFPSGKGYPTAEDDRFWAASLDLSMPITSHTAGGSTRMLGRDEPSFEFPKIPVEGTDPLRQLFRFCGDAAFAPVQMAFAGVWDRFPKLKVYWGETMIGWLPYALWQIDDHYERYKYLARYHWGLDWLERPPSDYIKQHCLWGFLSDPVGLQMRQAAGAENLLWGSDFAHAASDPTPASLSSETSRACRKTSDTR